MKKFLRTAAALVFALSLSVTWVFADENGPAPTDLSATQMTILSVGDFHGMVDNLMSDSDPGSARLAAAINYVRDQYENVHVVISGDNFHGHPLSNYLEGRPAQSLFEFLGVEYSALGNHEFSFGSQEVLERFTETVTLLAADVFYAPGHPRVGQRPDWVQPYAIIESDCGNASIALVGLTTNGMRHLVSELMIGHLHFRTPTLGYPNNLVDEYISDLENLIAGIRSRYGVGAVVALTHMGTPGPGGHAAEASVLPYIVEGFDAVLGGHTHRWYDGIHNGVPVVEGGWHGRGFARLTFGFDTNGNLVGIDTLLYGTTIAGGAGSILMHSSDVLPEGMYDEYVQAMMDEYEALAEEFLGQTLGVRAIYGLNREDTTNQEDRDHRNMWVTQLVYDAVYRATGETGMVFVSNYGGWRNVGPFEWMPEDYITMRQMIATMPFNNAILLFEMQGNDLLTLLNMDAGRGVDTFPDFDLNGGQPPVVSGAFRGSLIDPYHTIEGFVRPRYQWFFSDGTPIRDDDTIYRVISSNFTWGGFGANGGDRFPFPGNNHGNALGMTFISIPEVLLDDGTTRPWNPAYGDAYVRQELGIELYFLRDAMIDTLLWRAERSPREFTSITEVRAMGNGIVAVTAPFSPYEDRGVNINNTRVTVTATPGPGATFRGWYVGPRRMSSQLEYSFVSNQDLVLTARFSE